MADPATGEIVSLGTKTQFIENVKKWVVLDSQLKLINERTKQMRELRRIASTDICKYMTTNQIAQSKISISDGELRTFEKKEYSPLTFGYIEKCLAKIIADKSQVDFLLQYLKENREITNTLDIRRTYHK